MREEYSDDYPEERRVRGLPEGSTWEDLRKIALYQRIINCCLLLLVLLYVGTFFLVKNATADTADLVALACAAPILVVVLASVVTTFLLAVKVYHPVVGVFLALAVMLGCFGLLILFVINQRATAVLTKNGIKVGFFGASQSQFKSGID